MRRVLLRKTLFKPSLQFFTLLTGGGVLDCRLFVFGTAMLAVAAVNFLAPELLPGLDVLGSEQQV